MRPLVFELHLPGADEAGQPVEHRHALIRADVAALGQKAQDVVERDADLAHLVGQVEQHPVLAVPADQAKIPVEDGDALFHLVERDLQQVAIVLQGLGGVVQQAEGIPEFAVMALEKQRQDQPRRGGADGAGQQRIQNLCLPHLVQRFTLL